jgi:hypothetical protein
MNFFELSIGSVGILIGLAIIVLAIVNPRNNVTRNILTGAVFIIIGAAIIWFGLQEDGNLRIHSGISDKYVGFLLVGFVMSLFILKGILDIREGTKNLHDKTSSSSLVFKSKFQILVAVIVTIWIVLILLVAVTQFSR